MDPVKLAFGLLDTAGMADVGTGRCARCAEVGRLTPTRAVVSPTFTGFDLWSGPPGGLCPACVWLYRTPTLRSVPHLVSQTPPSLSALSLDELFTILVAGALRPTFAVSVPLRPGRKHLFADIRWGTIRTDHANLSWTVADSGRLLTVRQLRQLGYSAAQIRSAGAPDYRTLTGQPSHTWSSTIQLWRSIDPWRTNSAWLDLALTLTKGTR